LREQQRAFESAGARLAAVGLGDSRYAGLFREETGITFPLLVDEERRAYRRARLPSASVLHLFRPENAAARTRAKNAGHRQHGLGRNPFQLGGSFVFGPGNVDLFVHVAKTFGDHASVEELLAVVRRA